MLQIIWRKLVVPEHFGWTWGVLHSLYTERHRHYHTIFHIEKCLEALDELTRNDPRINREIASLALIWHDAVYVPGSPTNEQLSADLWRAISPTTIVVAQLATSDIRELVAQCILATKHHGRTEPNPTMQAVVDVDMSILGSDWPMYSAYKRWVRQEFQHVDDEAFRTGRKAFLEKQLTSSRIFWNDWMHEKYETQARNNIRQELSELGK
jgi:predicted metal-dependent HD superfamily phosphohydrolase